MQLIHDKVAINTKIKFAPLYYLPFFREISFRAKKMGSREQFGSSLRKIWIGWL